jgi:hypothetical protein
MSKSTKPRGGGSRKGSLKDQLEVLMERDPRFEKVFGTEENFSVDENGFSQCSKNIEKRKFKHKHSSWYKDDAENQRSVESSSGRDHQRHHSESVKERKMEHRQQQDESTIFKAAAEKIGEKSSTKVDAAEEALKQGFEMGKQAAAAEKTGEAAKEAAKGAWGGIKAWANANRTKLGILIGVAGTVGATAAAAAYKERQGQRSMRVGDTTVAWNPEGGAPGTMGGPAGAAAGGGAGGAGGGDGGRGR